MTENAQDEGQGQPGQAGATDGGGSPAAAGAAADAPLTPEQKVVALEAERADIKDRLLRNMAEFENWKKRARKEQTDGESKARESVLRDVLDIADNLERAVSAGAQAAGGNGAAGAADPGGVLKGVTLVLRLLQQKLERHEVRPFESYGQPFDPRVHEAISRVEHPEVPSGSVAVELQKGYKIGDRLLRPAMVSVSTGPKQG